jgi:hypothetical protein
LKIALNNSSISWEVGGEDDVLDLLVGKTIDVEVVGQPGGNRTLAFSTPALLPGCIGVAK